MVVLPLHRDTGHPEQPGPEELPRLHDRRGPRLRHPLQLRLALRAGAAVRDRELGPQRKPQLPGHAHRHHRHLVRRGAEPRELARRRGRPVRPRPDAAPERPRRRARRRGADPAVHLRPGPDAAARLLHAGGPAREPAVRPRRLHGLPRQRQRELRRRRPVQRHDLPGRVHARPADRRRSGRSSSCSSTWPPACRLRPRTAPRSRARSRSIGCGPSGDGCGGQIDCGTCPPPDTCGGGGVFGQCGYPDAGSCKPKTCAELGYTCGANGDGCGNVIQCGACTAPEICGGGGSPSRCGGP